jgi:hypothetical protein
LDTTQRTRNGNNPTSRVVAPRDSASPKRRYAASLWLVKVRTDLSKSKLTVRHHTCRRRSRHPTRQSQGR